MQSNTKLHAHSYTRVLQTPEHLKTEAGEESFNPDGLAQRSIKLLKDTFPDIEVSMSALHYVRGLSMSLGKLCYKHVPTQLSFSVLECLLHCLASIVPSGPSILPPTAAK